jgi:hypothetical protein
MTATTAQTSSADGGSELPRPRRGARWRWSRPHQALVAGGALAAVLSLGLGTGASAGAASTAGNTGGAHGHPPAGAMTKPTVSGKISALSSDDITVETSAKASVTVTYSTSTTFKTNAGPGAGSGTTSSASALKVGDFIGVQGTKNTDGSVTATSVTIGRAPQMGKGGPAGAGKSGAGNGERPPSGSPMGA